MTARLRIDQIGNVIETILETVLDTGGSTVRQTRRYVLDGGW